MSKSWLVAKETYRRRVRSGTFLILTFGIPLLMIIAGAVPILTAERSSQVDHIGLVDQSGRLAPVSQVEAEGTIFSITTYSSAEGARRAADRSEIGGYLVVSEEYWQTGRADYYAEEAPSASLEAAMTRLVQRAMLPDRPNWALERLANPSDVTMVADGGRVELAQGPGLIVRLLAPVVMALFFALAVLTGASQMGSAIVQEKEQRSMEMIITSLSPRQLITGKVLGLTLLSLTQLAVWGLSGIIAMGLLLSGDGGLGTVSIPWTAVLWAILLGVPAYFLYAVTASGLGIIAGDRQQAQQLAGVLGIVGLMPLWLAAMVVEAPNGIAAVALTLFPLTAPMFALIRMVMVEVPLWQLAAGFGLIVASLAGSIWLVARIFRAAMLMYGQSLRPRQLLKALREA